MTGVQTCALPIYKYSVAPEILKARAKNIRALVVIKADKDASFGMMQDIMKAMQENNLERFLIITDQETDKGDVSRVIFEG